MIHWTLGPVEDDPVLGSEGYPHEVELQRISEWPWEGGFRSLMDYVHRRWQYADVGYWEQEGDRFAISTGGWSGNESLVGAMEANMMFQSLCAVSWQTGGHYVYDVRVWDENEEPGKRVFVRDPATPLGKHGRVVATCDWEHEMVESHT